MKKLLIGCGCLSILLFCLAVGAFVWLGIRVKRYAEDINRLHTQIEATNRKHPFTAPNPPLLEADRVRAFLKIRQSTAKALSQETGLLIELQQASRNHTQPQVSARDILKIVSLPIRLPKLVGGALTQALEENKMSLDEYQWTARMATGTLLKGAQQGKETSQKILDTYAKFAVAAGLPPPPKGKALDLSPLQAALQVSDIPFHENNLKVLNEFKDDLAADSEMLLVELFIREGVLGTPSSNFTPPKRVKSSSSSSAGKTESGAAPADGETDKPEVEKPEMEKPEVEKPETDGMAPDSAAPAPSAS